MHGKQLHRRIFFAPIGRNVTTLVCLIRSKSKSEKHLILNSSALAIGSGFGSPHNEYKPSENEEFNWGSDIDVKTFDTELL
jgi:hypothetical protein